MMTSIHVVREWQHSMFGDATLQEICQSLMHGTNGSGEEWRPVDIRVTLALLKSRANCWDTTVESRVDKAVKELVLATIEEVENIQWWQEELKK